MRDPLPFGRAGIDVCPPCRPLGVGLANSACLLAISRSRTREFVTAEFGFPLAQVGLFLANRYLLVPRRPFLLADGNFGAPGADFSITGVDLARPDFRFRNASFGLACPDFGLDRANTDFSVPGLGFDAPQVAFGIEPDTVVVGLPLKLRLVRGRPSRGP